MGSVAAATATLLGQSQVLVFSGSTGAHVKDPDPRPEFPREGRAYHTIVLTQAAGGALEANLVADESRPLGGTAETALRFVHAAPDLPAYGPISPSAIVAPEAATKTNVTDV